MMRSVYVLGVALVSLVGCVDLPNESPSTVSRLLPNRLLPNRISAARVSASRIAASHLADGRLTVNPDSTDELLATEDGREVFSLIVSCALPDDVTLVASIDGNEFEFFGEAGLAPRWVSRPLDRDGQRWVSACLFSRLNANEVALPISTRGGNQGLDVSADERAGWTLEEGAFYGNFFGPVNQPLQWYACRGRDQAAGEVGGLIGRDCAEPDPANPGFTKCGFIFAGDCGDFGGDRACESFARNGTYYRRCHTAPIEKRHDCGRDDHGRESQVFAEVITTFVLP